MKIIGNMNSLMMLNQLKRYQGDMAKITKRLIAGTGLPSPADGPTEYAMSERWQTKAVASNAWQGNTQNAISLLQTFQTGYDEILSTLNDIKDKIEFLNGPVNQTDRDEAQIYVDEMLATLEDVANTAQYNNHYLFKAASNPQGRDNTMVAFGPDIYQENVSAVGVRNWTNLFPIADELQDIERTFDATALGATFQTINDTADGGYLEALQDAFTIGVDEVVPLEAESDSFTAAETQRIDDAFTS